MRRIILDTDIGHDIDDAYALAYALRCPALELAAVLTAGGYGAERAHTARVLLKRARRHVPVLRGAAGGAVGHVTHRVPGGRTGSAPRLDASTELLRALAGAGPLTLVCIGGLTNAAYLLDLLGGNAVQHLEIVAMGGAFERNYRGAFAPVVEGNIGRDVCAARRVLSGPVPVTLVPLDCTWNLAPDPLALRAMHHPDAPFGPTLEMLHGQWKEAFGYDSPILHDPFTVAVAADAALACFEEYPVEVCDDGRTRRAAAGPNVRVAVRARKDAFMARFARRLAPAKVAAAAGAAAG